MTFPFIAQFACWRSKQNSQSSCCSYGVLILYIISDTKAPAKKNLHRAPRATSATFAEKGRDGKMLPERVDLGLRLTVGEDVNQKPFLPNSQGSGHFPESSPYTEPALNAAYYPRQNVSFTNGADSAYICGTPSSLIAVIVIILVINVAMIAAFLIFYRQKRKHWGKRVGVDNPPPPLPSRPASSMANASSTPGVMFKSPYNQPQGVNRQRISSLHSSMTSLPRGDLVEQ